MYSTKIHKVIRLIISFLYHIGIWHSGDGKKPTLKELRVKYFYFIYHALFLLSLVVGATTAENVDKSIFLSDVSAAVMVMLFKLWILIWKQDEIVALLNRICVFSIRYDEDFSYFHNKSEKLAKFVAVFLIATVVTALMQTVFLPFVGSGRFLFLEISFPLDWKNSDVAFYVATFFIFTQNSLTTIPILFSTLIWYLLLTCSLRYEVLGSELRKLGREQIIETPNIKLTERRTQNHFLEGLKCSVDTHVHLRELTDELGSFLSTLFFTQFGTSGLCICGSIYCLAFGIGDNLLEHFTHFLQLLYYFFELLMITYFGNEIMLSSNRLSYSLFESNWIDQPQSTKKCIIIFGELLQQPHVLFVGKLYPLALETFTKVGSVEFN